MQLKESTTTQRSYPPADTGFVAIILVACSGLVAASVIASATLQETAIVGISVQLATAACVIRRSGLLSITGAFVLLWMVYFPIRLAVISFGGPSPYYSPTVDLATGTELRGIWILTTTGLTLFLLAGRLPALRASSRHVASLSVAAITKSQFLTIGWLGAALTTGLLVLHGISGILGNAAALTLFGIAGASYLEHSSPLPKHPHTASMILTAAAVVIGYATGQKEAALTPIAAWIIARSGAGNAIRLRHVVVTILVVGVTFTIIQGERSSIRTGTPITNPFTALVQGPTHYNLAYGVPAHFGGIAIVSNILQGVMYRLKGADYLIAISSQVPSTVPYQHGQSLWEPALSVLHAQKLLTLAPQYRHLSLGRYVDQTFVSEDPSADSSSQSMTIPGDLFLNFGSLGVLTGMFGFGLLYAAFDRHFTVRSPTGVAVFVYAGIPLIGLDSNIAYLLVTSAIRLGIAFLVIRLFLNIPVATTQTLGSVTAGSRSLSR